MNGGDIEHILQRIDKAMARIDAALRGCDGKAGNHCGTTPKRLSGDADCDLASRNARLEEAVTGAISQIDALIAHSSNGAAGNEATGNGAG